MTNTLATIYCHRSLPPKSNFWRFKTTVAAAMLYAFVYDALDEAWYGSVESKEFLKIATQFLKI